MKSALAPGSTIHIGAHSLARDERIVRMTMCGDLSPTQTEELLMHYGAVVDEQGYALIVMFVGNGGGMSMPARKAASEWSKVYGPHVRSAVIGASFVMRTGIELMNRAANLLTRRAVPIGFFDTEEEAVKRMLAQLPTVPLKK